MDKPQQITLIAVCVALAVLLDWQIMRWLKKRTLRVRLKKLPGSQPEAPCPPFQILPLLDFFLAVALIGYGQYLLASQGAVSYGISVWLNQHFYLDTPNLDNVLTGLPIMLVGCILLIRCVRPFSLPAGETNPGGLRQNSLPLAPLCTRSVRLYLAGAGLVFLSLILWLANKQYSGLSLVIWLVVPLVFLALAWRWDRQSGISLSPELTRRDVLWMTGLLLVGLLVASFRLQALPNQMIGDEGNFWTTARDIARGIYHPVVFDFGVYTYGILSSIGQTAVLKVFGITFWGWRFSSVLAGVITIPPLYLLGRELFDRRVAVASTLALISAPYFLAFARLGYNNIQTLFIVTLTIYWFYLGYKRSSAFYLLLAGCAAGLGSYTYSAAGSLVPIVFLFLLASLAYRPKNFRSLLKAGAIFSLGWLLLALPQTVYGMAVSPDSARTKFLESIFFNTGYSSIYLGDTPAFQNAARMLVDRATLFFAPGPYAILLVRGVFRTLIAFHQSFLVTEHFISSPLAGPFAVIFYIIGVCLALAGFRQRRFALLLIWFGFMALALSAASTFPPRHQHMVGLIPAMALLIGAGLVTLVDHLGRLVPRFSGQAQKVFTGLLVLAVSASGLYNFFVSMPRVYRPNFEQIIAWYGLYAQDQPFYYVYSLWDRPDFKPYILNQMRKDVPYTYVSADALTANPSLARFAPHAMVFFYPDATNQVLAVLEKVWGKALQTTTFYNYEWQVIGRAAWASSIPVVLPASFTADVVDSYNRPVAWLIVFLAVLIIFCWAARRAWLERTPAWMRRGVDWLFQPAAALETGSQPVSAAASSGVAIEGSLPQVEAEAPPERGVAPEAVAHRPFIELEVRLRINLPRPAGPAPAWMARLRSSLTAPGPALVTPLLGGLALVLGMYGQYHVFFEHDLQPWIWYLLVGAVIFLILSLRTGLAEPARTGSAATKSYLISSPAMRQRLVILAVIISLGMLSLLRLRNDHAQFWDLLIEWAVSVLVYLLAFMPRMDVRPALGWLRKNWKSLLPLGAIMLVGAAVRFYRLGAIPLVMENDEGIVGMQAVRVLNGSLTNMFQTSGGYGTLHFFLMAILVKLFGQTRLALRLLPALAGLASLPVVYLLARRMFDHRIALISAWLMAVTHIYIQFGRVSPTASSLDPLFSALSFYLVYRALQTRRIFDWVLSGVVMSFALYFYVGARAIGLVFVCSMLLIAIFKWRLVSDNWRGLLGMGGAYLVTAAPMLFWAVTRPDIFNTRMNQIGILNNGWLAAEMGRQGVSALTIILEQLANSLLIFNYHPARWFYEANMPMLGPLTGVLLAFGLLAALPRLRQPRFILLNCWFWGTLIAGQVLVVDPPPSGYRTLGLLPAVCILAAVALTRLAQACIAGWRAHAAQAVAVLIILALLGEAGWNVHYYFGEWVPFRLYSDVNSRRASLIGDYLGKQPPGTAAYIASSASFRSQGWSALEFLSVAIPYQDVDKPMAEFLPEIAPASHYVFIFPPGREDELSVVEKAFPGGKRFEQVLSRDAYFFAYQK